MCSLAGATRSVDLCRVPREHQRESWLVLSNQLSRSDDNVRLSSLRVDFHQDWQQEGRPEARA